MKALLLVLAASAAVLAWFGRPYLAARGPEKLRHLPGPLSDGHAQIELACDTCHTPFGGVSNAACMRCHEAGLAAGEDAHPESKFSDPRNAERTAKLDARRCVTCHAEHVPARTSRGGVTLAEGFCRACHEDVAADRPDHAGLPFTGCAATGCHNFHDNRALNEKFLAKHLGEPSLLSPAVMPARARKPLEIAQDDAPAELASREASAAWATSAHRRAGVSCLECHKGGERRPAVAVCRRCHEAQVVSFGGGKHGMRPAAGLPAMTPALARRAMKPEAHDKQLGCGTCHDVHSVDTRRAAVDACLGCHDDDHSLAYASSPHHRAWLAELAGTAPAGSGVSCATCHMPGADHNQNANLRPTTKMVRGACGHCHGVGYALDALADASLVARSFDAAPALHLQTMEWVAARKQRKEKRK